MPGMGQYSRWSENHVQSFATQKGSPYAASCRYDDLANCGCVATLIHSASRSGRKQSGSGRCYAIETLLVARPGRIGELELASRNFRDAAQPGPVGECQRQIRGAKRGEAHARHVGEAELERAEQYVMFIMYFVSVLLNLYRLLRITEIPHCRSPKFPRQLSGVEGLGGA